MLALVRLLSISFFSLLCVGILLYGLRIMGLSTPHNNIQHPLFKQKAWIINDGSANAGGPESSMANLKYSHKTYPNQILQVHTQVTRDNVWILFKDNKVDGFQPEPGFIFLKTYKQLKEAHKDFEIVKLSDFLVEFKGTTLLLNVIEKDAERVKTLAIVLRNFANLERILITSRYYAPNKVLQPQLPRLLYDLPESQYAQLLILSNLWIEPVARIKADFLILKPKQLSKPIVRELKRRNKRLLIKYDHLKSDPPTHDGSLSSFN